MRAQPRIVWMGVGLMLLACGGTEPSPAPQPAASSTEGGEEQDGRSDIRGHMATNFKLAMDARDAVINGDLPGAQAAAKTLAFHDHSKVLPERWTDDVKKMQDAAADVAMATDLAKAGQAVAELASTCGDCHARLKYTGDEDKMEHGLSPSDDENIHQRMLRHQRAADGLWFGLTIPSNNAWREGSRALTEAPMAAPQEDGKPIDPALNDKMEEILGLGRAALEAEGREQRTKAYGTLLVSCANCHADE